MRAVLALTVEVSWFVANNLHRLIRIVSGVVVMVKSWFGNWQAFLRAVQRLRSINLWLFLLAFSSHIVDLAVEGLFFVSLVEDVAHYN